MLGDRARARVADDEAMRAPASVRRATTRRPTSPVAPVTAIKVMPHLPQPAAQPGRAGDRARDRGADRLLGAGEDQPLSARG